MSGLQLFLLGALIFYVALYREKTAPRRGPRRRGLRDQDNGFEDIFFHTRERKPRKPRTRKVTGEIVPDEPIFIPAGLLPARAANPSGDPLLVKARKMSRQFHGHENAVMELTDKERLLPKYVLVAGQLQDFGYKPDRHSERGGYVWEHKSGDRGMFGKVSPNKPLMAVDPITKRPLFVAKRSGMRFKPDKGFVG